jgi:ribosomal protein S18 acetylase RimI-like enzyme
MADLAERAFVFGVYLAPDLRAHGIADDLFDRVERWVHAEGHHDLHLYVHESNARAIAFYRRRGYTFTGGREPYRLDPTQSELEMRRQLG